MRNSNIVRLFVIVLGTPIPIIMDFYSKEIKYVYFFISSAPEGSCLTQKTPPNPKTFTPVMRSKRLTSSRRIPHSSCRKMTPMSRQLNKNLFGETSDMTTLRPTKTLLLDPPNNDLPEEELFFQPIRYSQELCREL